MAKYLDNALTSSVSGMPWQETGSRCGARPRGLNRKAGENLSSELCAVTSRRLFLGALRVSSALVEDDVCYVALVVLKELHFRVHDFQEEFRF